MPAAGCYFDTVSEGGVVRWQTGAWCDNLIVSSAWPLVAALLRSEPGVRGILYCAFGEGDPAWDTSPAAPTPDTTRLRREVTRVTVAAPDIRYVDGQGTLVTVPTHRLALTVTLVPAGTHRRLREFGLFGGDATATPNSGRLINHAIHPAIELRPGQTLTRAIRLTFRPGGTASAAPTDVSLHWFSAEPVTLIDGVGASIAEAFKSAQVVNVGQLAVLDATQPPEGVSVGRAVEFKAKARLALQTAAQLLRIPELDDWTVDQVLTGPVPDAVAPEAVERLHEQIGFLQVALDARSLRRLTLKQLRAGP